MQIVSNVEQFIRISNPIFSGENKKQILNLSSTEFAQRVLRLKKLKIVLSGKTGFLKRAKIITPFMPGVP